MIQRILKRLQLYGKIRFFRYIYLNYLCKNVIRTDRSRIIPYRGAVLALEPGSRLYVGGGDVELGCDRLKGSGAETLVRLRKNAVWSSEGGCRISYGSTVEVLPGGLLDSRFFTMNSGSVIAAAKKIHLGQDVMIGRGVVIYDSDYHTIRDPRGRVTNPDAPVTVGEHVWLGTNVTVLKGTTIGGGSMVAAGTVVHGTIPADSQCLPNRVRENYGAWSREHPSNQEPSGGRYVQI